MKKNMKKEKQETPFGLPFFILDQLIIVFKKYPEVESVMIYGSRAKGNFRDGSDIDLAVFGPKLTPEDFAMLCSDLEDLSIIFKIDCVHFENIKRQILKEKISQEGRLIFPLIKT